MNRSLKLSVPLVVARDDLERAWLEQAIHVPSVARSYNHLRAAAERAIAPLNQALDIDVFNWFTRGWIAVGAVRDAMQRSAAESGPPLIVGLDRHTVTSASSLVLQAELANSPLSELKLVMQLVARVASATLAVKDGRIELLALGEAIVTERLKYNNVVLNQHVTGVEGAPRDPFKRPRAIAAQKSRVDAGV